MFPNHHQMHFSLGLRPLRSGMVAGMVCYGTTSIFVQECVNVSEWRERENIAVIRALMTSCFMIVQYLSPQEEVDANSSRDVVEVRFVDRATKDKSGSTCNIRKSS